MKHALYIAPFNELADPRIVMDLAMAAEASGWHGLFLWDHVLRPRHESIEIADPWVTLAAVATCTTTLTIGPMVTPVTRRRPQKLAREATTLDHLSGGRLVLGLGLGVDSGRELSGFGEVVDVRERARRLDEGAELLSLLWSGEVVTFRGEHFLADDVLFRPRPVQQPRIPLWFAARTDALAPVRRAARYDGLFPIDVDEVRYRRMVDAVVEQRGSLDGFDIAVLFDEGSSVPTWAADTATWVMRNFGPGATRTEVMQVATAGPPH